MAEILKECKDVGCNRSHHWFEDAADGRRFLCFHAGTKKTRHIKKIDLAEMVFTSIRKVPKFARSFLEGLQA